MSNVGLSALHLAAERGFVGSCGILVMHVDIANPIYSNDLIAQLLTLGDLSSEARRRLEQEQRRRLYQKGDTAADQEGEEDKGGSGEGGGECFWRRF